VRDIAKELGIANPSIYYHFKSKVDILIELLNEPLKTVGLAVAEAKKLNGEARTRRIIEGLLDALEVHQGIVLTTPPEAIKTAASRSPIIFETIPNVAALLAETSAKDNRELRVMMTIGAVEACFEDSTVMNTQRCEGFSVRSDNKIRATRELHHSNAPCSLLS
jgi:AcrR family transcriptional regulator